MAASYPSAAKTFSTKATNDTIEASHVNDIQDEVTAVESALLNGLAHDLKFTDALYDIGKSGATRPRDGFFSRNFSIGGTLAVTGVATLTSPIINTTLVSNKLIAGICEGRLTLTSATPVTTADVTAAATIYWTPYKGTNTALYDGAAAWTLLPFVETSLALGTITNDLPYDVFAYNNSGTLALELLAWTSKTARATALVLQDGVWVKTGATTRRYLGTFHTTSATTTEDSFAKRLLWNYYNRVRRPLRRFETADSWTYSTATWRQANANTANQLAVVIGVAEVAIDIDVQAGAANNNAGVLMSVAVKEDATTGPSFPWTSLFGDQWSPVANHIVQIQSKFNTFPAVGYHFYAWIEYSAATPTTTWYGDNGGANAGPSSGMVGVIEG